MNPRMEWIAREVLPTLYNLACLRAETARLLSVESKKARQAELDADERSRRAGRALEELRLLLLSAGYTSEELDVSARGSKPPAAGPSLHDGCESEVPL